MRQKYFFAKRQREDLDRCIVFSPGVGAARCRHLSTALRLSFWWSKSTVLIGRLEHPAMNRDGECSSKRILIWTMFILQSPYRTSYLRSVIDEALGRKGWINRNWWIPGANLDNKAIVRMWFQCCWCKMQLQQNNMMFLQASKLEMHYYCGYPVQYNIALISILYICIVYSVWDEVIVFWKALRTGWC